MDHSEPIPIPDLKGFFPPQECPDFTLERSKYYDSIVTYSKPTKLDRDAAAYCLWEALWGQSSDAAFERVEAFVHESAPVATPSPTNMLKRNHYSTGVHVEIEDQSTIDDPPDQPYWISRPFEFFGNRRFLVRKEYRVAVKYCLSWEVEYPENGFAIDGHPGIGKSAFIYFLLYLRLLDKQVTTFNRPREGKAYIFDSSGVHVMIHDNAYECYLDTFPKNSWVLADLDKEYPVPMPSASGYSTQFTVVQYMMEPDKWRHTYGFVSQYHMHPWTLNEVYRGNALQETQHSIEHLQNFYSKFGPIPQYIYTYASFQGLYELQLRDTLRRLKRGWQDVRNILLRGFDDKEFQYPGVERVFLHSHRVEPRNYRNKKFMTPYIASLIARKNWPGDWDAEAIRTFAEGEYTPQELFDKVHEAWLRIKLNEEIRKGNRVFETLEEADTWWRNKALSERRLVNRENQAGDASGS